MNMNQWLNDTIHSPIKKSMPVLSFPGIQFMGINIEELVKSAENQAICMETIAKEFDSWISVSLMDLSVEAEAFGSHVVYSADEVPTIEKPLIQDEEAANKLEIPAVGAARTGVCVEGIRMAVEKIQDKPVFAGIIGPFSLAGRLLDMTEVMYLCYDDEELLHTVLKKATAFLIAYTKAFKEAGAAGIVLAEPAAGLLSPNLIKEFSNPYVQELRDAVEDDEFLVVYHNCGNVKPILKELHDMHAKAYSFGNSVDMELAVSSMPEDSLVIGNLDPSMVFVGGTPESIREDTLNLLERCSKYPNFVIASGCDIPAHTPLENIRAFFDAVDEFYSR